MVLLVLYVATATRCFLRIDVFIMISNLHNTAYQIKKKPHNSLHSPHICDLDFVSHCQFASFFLKCETHYVVFDIRI